MTVTTVPGSTDLGERLAALEDAVELASGRLDAELVVAARRVLDRVDARLRVGTAHTVVALAGATGSGKSSLFNALAGAPLSTVGVRRPTTSSTLAATWGEGDVGPLLDWLGVEAGRRHVGVAPAPDGLVLLDLPDHDSVRRDHREEVDRLVGRADLLVWVLDPQKYADAAIHDGYLRRLTAYDAVMVVVLNQADRLTPTQLDACVADLSGLLVADGLAEVPVLTTSAVAASGLDGLRALVADRVAARRAAVARLTADIAAAAGDLVGVGAAGVPSTAGLGPADRDHLVVALAAAVGVDAVVAAVGGSHRRQGHLATGWPVSRSVARFRRDPLAVLRRERLGRLHQARAQAGVDGGEAASASASPSGLDDVAAARTALAISDAVRRAGDDLADPWPGLLRRAVPTPGELASDLVHAVASPDVALPPPPRWWRAVNAVQQLLVVVAVAGLVWLTVLGVVAWLRLPEPPTPEVGAFPLPTLALLGGALAGLLVAGAARPAVARGAGRREASARRTLEASLGRVADERVLGPLSSELDVRSRLCAAVGVARGGGRDHVAAQAASDYRATR